MVQQAADFWYNTGGLLFPLVIRSISVRNILPVLSTFLLVCVPLSSSSVAQRRPEVPPTLSDPFVPRTPEMPQVAPTPLVPLPQAPAGQELQNALQELNRLVQQARSTNNSMSQELQTAVQNLQRAVRVAFTARPATQSPVPVNTQRNPLNAALNAEREKAYIDLARQYFYAFIDTPVEVLAATPPVTASSRLFSPDSAIDPVTGLPVTGLPVEAVNDTLEAAVEVEVEEKGKSEREEILENFVECVKKISPAAQIVLISELIRTAHTNEELKLLEGLLDEVLNPPATTRVPNAGQQDTPRRPAADPAMQRDVPRRPDVASPTMEREPQPSFGRPISR